MTPRSRWSEAALGELVMSDAPIRYGIVQVGPYKREGVPTIAVRDLLKINPEHLHRSDPSLEENYKGSRVEANDVLVSVKGTTGRVGIVPEGLKGNISRDVARVRFRQDQVPGFWVQLLRSPEAQKRLSQAGVGTTRQELSIGTLREIKFAYPPKIVQEAVLEALDSVDDLIEQLVQLIAKKRAIKQGMMQELMTGRTRLRGFEGEWGSMTLGSVCRIKTGARNNQDKVPNGAYPFFVRSATVERIDSYSYDTEAILVPGEGGIGTIFHYIKGRFEVHQRVYKISDFASNVSGKFVYYFMRVFFGSHAMENSVKATVDSLRLPTFKSFELRLPPTRAEQEAIVEVLEVADAEIEALEKRLEATRQIKEGMMQELLTGRTRLV